MKTIRYKYFRYRISKENFRLKIYFFYFCFIFYFNFLKSFFVGRKMTSYLVFQKAKQEFKELLSGKDSEHL